MELEVHKQHGDPNVVRTGFHEHNLQTLTGQASSQNIADGARPQPIWDGRDRARGECRLAVGLAGAKGMNGALAAPAAHSAAHAI